MASSTPKLHTIQHFTHIHPLTEFDSIDDFTCDGCKTYGTGKTYRCEACNYYLHEYCATCPLTLPIFIHPQHELSLVFRKQQSTRQNVRLCVVCDESVEGLFYRCKICEFDLHPLCTKLPQHVMHVLHPAHHLEFRLAHEASPCMVCHGPCQSWRYRCELCKFDIHTDCILARCSTSPSDQTEESGSKSIVLKPPAGHCILPVCSTPPSDQTEESGSKPPAGQPSYQAEAGKNPGQESAARAGRHSGLKKGLRIFMIASKVTLAVASIAVLGPAAIPIVGSLMSA